MEITEPAESMSAVSMPGDNAPDRMAVSSVARRPCVPDEIEESFTCIPDGLSAREIDVLRLLGIGRSNKDIAKALSISLNTVATHVRNILAKTHCANRTEAAIYAGRNKLVETP